MKRLILMITALFILLSAAACSGSEPADPPASSEPPLIIEPTPTPKPPPTPEPPYSGPRDPLTGLPTEEDISGNRPLAVVMGNRSVSQPHLGVSAASIIFEVPVEGGYTRTLAIFQDIADAGEICSIRSARTCFVDIAQGFDAIFIHGGGSNSAYTAMNSRRIDRIDGVNGSRGHMFFRNDERRRTQGLEHSLATTEEKINELLPTFNMRLTHDEGYNPFLMFEDGQEIGDLTEENAAHQITIQYSAAKTTTFTYDAVLGEYTAAQFGGIYRDGNTGDTVTFANLILIETRISVVSGDPYGLLDVAITGSGTGYIVVGGVWREINWEKESASSPYRFTYPNGSDVTLRSGRTYIGVMRPGAAAIGGNP